MNDIVKINKDISESISMYLQEHDLHDKVLFESKILFHNSSLMFTMMMKTGSLAAEPFKLVLPGPFIQQSDQASVIKMICDFFKNALVEHEKLYGSVSNLSEQFNGLNILGK